MTNNRIDEIRARCEAATRGPWDFSPGGAIYHSPLVLVAHVLGSGEDSVSDAVFIAHAREDIPYLLDELDRLVAENEQLAKNGGQYMKIAEKRYEMYEAECKRREELEAELSRIEAERDAAVADIIECISEYAYTCKFCKKWNGSPCVPCKPEWRGPKKEENDADD